MIDVFDMGVEVDLDRLVFRNTFGPGQIIRNMGVPTSVNDALTKRDFDDALDSIARNYGGGLDKTVPILHPNSAMRLSGLTS